MNENPERNSRSYVQVDVHESLGLHPPAIKDLSLEEYQYPVGKEGVIL
jgi:hypothetical protein